MKIASIGINRMLAVMLFLTTYSFVAFGASNEIVQTLPPKASSHQASHKANKTLLQQFHDNYGRLYYFALELTHNIDSKKNVQSYDYVNPHMVSGFKGFMHSIIPGINLLENAEKTKKERDAIQDIKVFLDTNYKNSYLPSRVYHKNDHIEPPLYVEQLKDLVFDAVARGDLYALRALLDNYNLVNITNEEGDSLLSFAILHNQDKVAELLIKKGIDINSSNRYGGSPIIVAARSGNFKILKLLAEYQNCNVFHRDKFGNAAIDYAYLTNNRQMHSYLKTLFKKSYADVS